MISAVDLAQGHPLALATGGVVVVLCFIVGVFRGRRGG